MEANCVIMSHALQITRNLLALGVKIAQWKDYFPFILFLMVRSHCQLSFYLE